MRKSSEKYYKAIKNFLLFLKSLIPFFLSHHPECEDFKGHTLKCGRCRLCIGCFIGYPTAIITLFLIRFLNFGFLFSTQPFLILSLVFLGTFFLSPLRLTKNKRIKIIQKLLIGIGSALLFNWIMVRPYSYTTNSRTAFIVFYLLLVILNLYHIYGILNSCYKCETPFNWGKCNGFCDIRVRMENNGLENYFLKFENFSCRLLEKREKRMKKSLLKKNM
ncbi:MAG: hypothetical protein ACW96X_02995 [Promethearchaeota archaeon]